MTAVMADAVLIDTAVAAYSLGEDNLHRAACRAFLSRVASGEFRAYASVEMIQELVHHRLRKLGDRRIATANGHDMAAFCTLLNFDREILEVALTLIEKHPTIRGRDAVHAATAIAYGIERIVSTDRAFDGIPGIRRIDPLTVGAE